MYLGLPGLRIRNREVLQSSLLFPFKQRERSGSKTWRRWGSEVPNANFTCLHDPALYSYDHVSFLIPPTHCAGDLGGTWTMTSSTNGPLKEPKIILQVNKTKLFNNDRYSRTLKGRNSIFIVKKTNKTKPKNSTKAVSQVSQTPEHQTDRSQSPSEGH